MKFGRSGGLTRFCGSRSRAVRCAILNSWQDPKSVKVNLSTGTGLDIEWKDGHQSHYSFPFLRDACPCALCDEERSQGAPAAGGASETCAGGVAHVQARRQGDFGGGRGQVRDQVSFQRRSRVGDLFVAVFAGLVSVRGVQGGAGGKAKRGQYPGTSSGHAFASRLGWLLRHRHSASTYRRHRASRITAAFTAHNTASFFPGWPTRSAAVGL